MDRAAYGKECPEAGEHQKHDKRGRLRCGREPQDKPSNGGGKHKPAKVKCESTENEFRCGFCEEHSVLRIVPLRGRAEIQHDWLGTPKGLFTLLSAPKLKAIAKALDEFAHHLT